MNWLIDRILGATGRRQEEPSKQWSWLFVVKL